MKPEFLQDGKVRNVCFITNPPVEIIQLQGKYGRANTPNSTCFYCSVNESVAVFETKPTVNDRIIVSRWLNLSGTLNIFPIGNNSVSNKAAKLAANAFIERMKSYHSFLSKIFQYYMDFLTSEFIKKDETGNQKKYEYIFSAYFADLILQQEIEIPKNNPEGLESFEAIMYPSVEYNHENENFAIKPEVVKNKLQLYTLTEFIIDKTDYPNIKIEEGTLPFEGRLLRNSKKIENGLIQWDDD